MVEAVVIRDELKLEDDQDYGEAECAVCSVLTRTRCGCQAVVCSECECPTGCDAFATKHLTPMAPLQDAPHALDQLWRKH